MPWASRPTESFLVSPSTMQRLAEEAGFRTVTLRDLTNTARSNMMRQEEAAAACKAAGEAPPLPAGDNLMGSTASAQQRNLTHPVQAAPVVHPLHVRRLLVVREGQHVMHA